MSPANSAPWIAARRAFIEAGGHQVLSCAIEGDARERLARIRKGLRKRGLTTDIPCVHSDEPVNKGFACEGDESPCERGGKRRTLGSLPTLTGIFGLTLANLALQVLLGDRFPD